MTSVAVVQKEPETLAKKAPVLVPFTCPICRGPNAVQLIALSRAGCMNCEKCGKRLRASDVMRAMHDPRK